MSNTINLAEARNNLPELADKANAGQTFVVARGGRELAVIIGIEEYHRLKGLENQQREYDFDVLLSPPDRSTMSEEEARTIAVEAVRQVRAGKTAP